MQPLHRLIQEVGGDFAAVYGDDLSGMGLEEPEFGPSLGETLKSNSASIPIGLWRGDRGRTFIRVRADLSDSGQSVLQDLLLGLQLIFIAQVLPMAAATLSKIVAEGYDAMGGSLLELIDRSSKVVLLVLRYGQFHLIPGGGEWDEDDLVLNVTDSLSPVCQ
jgi:hypothetical protein